MTTKDLTPEGDGAEATAIRELVTDAFIDRQRDTAAAASDPPILATLYMLHRLLPGQIAEAREAHTDLLNRIASDLENDGIVDPEHVTLLNAVSDYLDASGWEYAGLRGGWMTTEEANARFAAANPASTI